MKLLHPRYVSAYVRHNKTDAADADALIRADLDRDLHPLPVKIEHQQAIQGLHRIRQQWVGTRTARISAIRGLMAEFGVALPRGTALIGRVTDINAFPRARSFSSWLGLTPREHSSGQTRRLGQITRAGDSYIRVLLTHGARSALLAATRKMRKGQRLTTLETWAIDLALRAGHNKATIALANKMARILWAMWTRGETYQPKYVKGS